MKFNDTLRHLLEERNISRKELASALLIAPSTLGNYLQGTREPDFETMIRIALYFGISTDQLLGFQNPKELYKSDDERELLHICRALSPDGRRLLIEQGKLLLKYSKD